MYLPHNPKERLVSSVDKNEVEILEPVYSTPIPVKIEQVEPRTMDFPDAIRKVMHGKKVQRVSWGNTDYVFIKDEWLSIFTKGAFHTLLVSQGDIEGNDWVVVEENN